MYITHKNTKVFYEILTKPDLIRQYKIKFKQQSTQFDNNNTNTDKNRHNPTQIDKDIKIDKPKSIEFDNKTKISDPKSIQFDKDIKNPPPPVDLDDNSKGEFILFLHGWGAGSEVLKPLALPLLKNIEERRKTSETIEKHRKPSENIGNHRKASESVEKCWKRQKKKPIYIQKSEFWDCLNFPNRHNSTQIDKDIKNSDREAGEIRCVFIDFPPFGLSGEPATAWTIYDYAEMVLGVLEAEKIKKVKIVAHSFGGRVAILLSGMYNIVDEMILIGSAGLKRRRSVWEQCRIWAYKAMRGLGVEWKNAGSEEYRVLSEVMKRTFVSVVNADLSVEAKAVRCATRLIYGTHDTATPTYMAKRFLGLISASELYLVRNAGHFVWI